MSKLLKSKFLLGVVVVAVMFVGVVAVSATPAAADCSITMTLRVGSTGTQVACLQTVVGATADGKFGPLTKASVMAWQSGHGLVADGVFGPKSNAVLIALGTSGGSFPAGCTSASGFSSTTGLSCAAGASTGPCTGGALFNSVTGASCSSTLPAGCTTTAGFSPTTGVSCSSGVTISSSGEGSLTVTAESSPSNGTEIAYDGTKAVMALKVKASGADMAVNRVDFNFSKRAWLYVNKAELFDGSTVVATRDLTSASFDEITSGTNYRLRFDGLNVTVAKDASKVLTLKLTAPSIISDPTTLVTITTATDGVRASDGTGLVSYEGVAATRTFKVTTATAGSLVVSLDSTSPKVQTVAVDDVDNTEGVSLLVAGLKATGDDVNVTEIPVVVTVVDTGAGTMDAVDDAVESVQLYKNGVQIASASYEAACATALNCIVTFSDLDETITKDTTAKYTVKATLKPIDGTIVKVNTTVQATMTVASIVAEDTNFSSLTGGELSGSAIGLIQHMYVVSPQLTFVSATTSTTAGDAGVPVEPILTGTITFKVKAVGGTIYLNKADTSGGRTQSALLEGNGGIDQGSTSTDTLTTTTYTISGVDVVDQGTTDYYAITDGQEVTVVATGYVTSLTPSGLQQVRVEGLQWGTVATAEANRIAQTAITWGLDDFHTQDVLLAFY